jgi:hypothetical protein
MKENAPNKYNGHYKPEKRKLVGFKPAHRFPLPLFANITSGE